MKKIGFVAVLCALAVAALGCSSGGTACDVKITSGSVTTHSCAEYDSLSGDQANAEDSACKAEGGTTSDSCPTANSLGTCAQSAGGLDYKTTFYSENGLTADQAKSACTSAGGTWTGA